jgi:hypothetical protein
MVTEVSSKLVNLHEAPVMNGSRLFANVYQVDRIDATQSDFINR